MNNCIKHIFYFGILASSVVFAQNAVTIHSIPRDNYYTIESAEKKVMKHYPSITRVDTSNLSGLESNFNLVYSKIGKRELHLDLFHPSKSVKKNPAIILIHGGGWRSGDRSMEIPMAKHLAANGYVTAVVEYRLSPESKYPAAIFDLKSAVRWLRMHALEYEIDTANIGVYGCSAGGHLASFLGVTNGLQQFEGPDANKNYSSDVQAVVNVDGPVDLTHPEESGRDSNSAKPSACTLWFGYSYQERPDVWKEASPINFVSRQSVPIAFINSSLERYHVGRDEMIAQLTRYKIYSTIHTLSDSPHSFWLFNPWFTKTLKYTKEFFDKYLKEK
ncbi:MAG: alpha/beta hydrolase [Bacteroidota bacterium]|nr:alpha/beta hydrolase [Bacteroidota bacterium]